MIGVSSGTGSSIGIGWVSLGVILFPIAIAYSILQYSVIDTERILSFATTYSLMAMIVVIGYAFIVAGFSLILNSNSGVIARSPIAVGLTTFLLVLVFQPARIWLQGIIDGIFFRAQVQYEERLTLFRQSMTAASSLSEIVRVFKQQLRETLMPTHVYIFLRDTHTNEFIAHGEGSRPDTDIRFDSQSGLVHALSTTRDILYLEFNKPLPPELVEDHASLAVLRTPIIAPLQGQERLAGWVAVGDRRSGQQVTIQDLRFIQALAEQASLAVERAQVIGDLERRVRELDVLSQVSQAVNFSTDPEVLMELIYTQTGKLIDTTNFYIVMNRKEIQALDYVFFLEGHERYEEREVTFLNNDVGLESEVIRSGRPIRTDDYLAECVNRNVRPNPKSKHHAWMGVPLNASNNTLGTMIAASYTQGVIFTDDQLKVFWAIADQAATALDKARLFRETENRSLQLQTLNEISKELSSTLDLENLLVRNHAKCC